jgi:hypothetical protein
MELSSCQSNATPSAGDGARRRSRGRKSKKSRHLADASESETGEEERARNNRAGSSDGETARLDTAMKKRSHEARSAHGRDPLLLAQAEDSVSLPLETCFIYEAQHALRLGQGVLGGGGPFAGFAPGCLLSAGRKSGVTFCRKNRLQVEKFH